MSRSVFVRWGQLYNDKLSVKITPATTLKDVRNQACEKRRINPDFYGLELNGRPLNLEMSVLLANIPNAAKLDLIQLVDESKVSLTLEIENGGRITEKINPDTSLWETLTHFQDQLRSPGKFTNPASGQPVLYFNDQQFFEEEHFQKTLRDIGISTGAAVLRIAFRNLSSNPVPSEFQAPKVPEISASQPKSNPPGTSPHPSQSKQESAPSQLIPKTKEKEIGENQQETRREPPAQQHVISEPIPRETKVFSAPKESRNLSEYEVPESFYELDKEDLMRLQFSKEKTQQQDTFLKTSAMREKEEKQKRARFAKTVIRVRLPDQIQLQGNFAPEEPISALHDWVKENLQQGVEFELIATPPRRVLSNSSVSLYDLGLVPSAIVFLHWKAENNQAQKFLKEEVHKQAQDLQIPEFLTIKENAMAIDSPAMSLALGLSSEDKNGEKPDPPSSSGNTSAPRQQPKWLKLAK